MALTIEHLRTLIQGHDDAPNIDVEKFIYPDGNYHYNVSLVDSGLNTVIDFTLDEETFQALRLAVTKTTHEQPYKMSITANEAWIYVSKTHVPEHNEWVVEVVVTEGGVIWNETTKELEHITIHSKNNPQVEHMDFT